MESTLGACMLIPLRVLTEAKRGFMFWSKDRGDGENGIVSCHVSAGVPADDQPADAAIPI